MERLSNRGFSLNGFIENTPIAALGDFVSLIAIDISTCSLQTVARGCMATARREFADTDAANATSQRGFERL
jgi:hypothetical protein